MDIFFVLDLSELLERIRFSRGLKGLKEEEEGILKIRDSFLDSRKDYFTIDNL